MFVLAAVDKAVITSVVVRMMYFINILYQTFGNANAYV